MGNKGRRESGEVETRHGHAIAETRDGKQGKVDNRDAALRQIALLPHPKQCAAHHGTREPPPPGRIIDIGAGGQHKRQHEGKDGDSEQQCADNVEIVDRALWNLLRFRQEPDGRHDRRNPQRDIHPEQQVPPHGLATDPDQETTQCRAKRGGQANDRPKNAKRSAALFTNK